MFYSVLLLLLLLTVFQVTPSPFPSSTSISSNTSTFIIKSLGKRIRDIPSIRSHFVSKPKSKTLPTLADLEKVRVQLTSIIRRNSPDYLIETFIATLFRIDPHTNHFNHIYRDVKTGTSMGLLHYAVESENFNLISLLDELSEGTILTHVKDSRNLTPLELACQLNSMEMINALLRLFPLCIDDEFMDFASIVHYAAANNAIQLLEAIRNSSNYRYQWYAAESQFYPLEMAINAGHLEAAAYLLKHHFYCHGGIIEKIYTKALNSYAVSGGNRDICMLIVDHHQRYMYVCDKEDKDLMLKAIEANSIDDIQEIFDMGYDHRMVTYNLIEKASSEASETVQKLIQSNIKKISRS